jgi:hypothetical protein
VKNAAGDLKGALADFSKAVELAPGNPTHWSDRGWLRYMLQDSVGALEDFDHAILEGGGLKRAAVEQHGGWMHERLACHLHRRVVSGRHRAGLAGQERGKVARDAGVLIRERTRLISHRRVRDGWELQVGRPEQPERLLSRFLVDASGRASSVARTNGATRTG